MPLIELLGSVEHVDDTSSNRNRNAGSESIFRCLSIKGIVKELELFYSSRVTHETRELILAVVIIQYLFPNQVSVHETQSIIHSVVCAT